MAKTLFSKSVSAGTRMYYMDVCEDTKGQRFLSISEIPTDSNPGKKKRQRIFIHANNIEAFAEEFNEVKKHLNTKCQ